MTTREIPFTFPCAGQPLVGVVHLPEHPGGRGVLAMVSGGPQYRAGCCRQLVRMARTLAEQGTPVMRFDYRGLGDGAGAYHGFRHVRPDLDAAIDAFARMAPSLREVVLWGGCDAASAVLMHGPEHPMVTGMILGNPFAQTEAAPGKAALRHYYWQRLWQKSFWRKLARRRCDPRQALRGLVGALAPAPRPAPPAAVPVDREPPFPLRMRQGAEKFRGRILLLMSGLSLVSKEFDAMVAASPEWRRALKRPGVTRVDFPYADQAFSSIAAREGLIAAAADWLAAWPETTVAPGPRVAGPAVTKPG